MDDIREVLDAYDHPYDLQIELYSDYPLNIDSILYINADSNTCDICMDGLEVSHITMEDVNQSFIINANVINNLLRVHINIHLEMLLLL